MNPIDQHVGKRLRERRAELGISLEELSHQLGVHADVLRQFEEGVTRVSAGTLKRAGSELNVHIGYFFEEAGTMDDLTSDRPAAYTFTALAEEGVALNRAFSSIQDPKLRADVLEHVQAVALYDERRRTDQLAN